MPDEMPSGWSCRYKAPNAARRPFTPEKTRDIVGRTCREFGMWETLKAAMAGLWDCGEAPAGVCEVLGQMADAARFLREEVDDYEVLLETAIGALSVAGVLTLKERAAIETAVKVLGSDAAELALRDLMEWLNCGEFRTGGGMEGGGEFTTGGGY